jgi:hypothetical protein
MRDIDVGAKLRPAITSFEQDFGGEQSNLRVLVREALGNDRTASETVDEDTISAPR